MKLYDGGVIIISIIIVALAAGYASSRWLGDDNPVEEAAESVIEKQTGLDIDLSPLSDEKKG
jgi:hypothetical protein